MEELVTLPSNDIHACISSLVLKRLVQSVAQPLHIRSSVTSSRHSHMISDQHSEDTWFLHELPQDWTHGQAVPLITTMS